MGSTYELGIDGKLTKVTIVNKGYLKMLLAIDGKEEWYENTRLTPAKQLKIAVTTDTVLDKVITENKPIVKKVSMPPVVINDKPKQVIEKIDSKVYGKPTKIAVHKTLKVNHDAVVPANKHTNERWSEIHKRVMEHLRVVLSNHGYEKVYNLKPSELIALVDKNISDYVE
jgi:hypothetical protein